MRTWAWAVQYGMAIVLALLLGAILGSIRLFKEAGLGTTGLNASNVVQFLGYSSALLLLWLLARGATMQIPEERKGLSFVCHTLVPLVTLVVVSAGYNVLLLLVGPFLGETGMTIYNWIFVLGIIGSALWLGVAGYHSSTLLVEAFEALRPAGQPAPPRISFLCPQCGATATAGMKFCGQCGQGLASAFCRQCRQPLTPGQKFCGSCGSAVGQDLPGR